MEVLRKGSTGEQVIRVQLELQERRLYPGPIDGDFGAGTERAVRAFQDSQGLNVDGVVGPKTWQALFSEQNIGETPQSIPSAGLSPLFEISSAILEFHRAFGSGVRWRLTPEGVEIESAGHERTSGEPMTVRRVWNEYGDSIERWALHYRVPSELILATICTETGGNADRVREEPGYESDELTPHRVSPGLMQTLISTARDTLDGEIPSSDVNREWLLNPDNSIRAGTAYIALQKTKTDFDPPKVACAYNAGGIYLQSGPENRWKMRQYPIGTSEHADRFVMWLNDFFAVKGSGEIKNTCGFFR